MVKFNNLMPAVRGLGVRAKYFTKDHSTQILAGTSIATGTAAVVLAGYAAYKKLPKIQADFDAALDKIQAEISDSYDDACEKLEDISQSAIDNMFDSSHDNDEGIDGQRDYINSLLVVKNTGLQCEAASYTKARLVRVGKVVWVFTPAAILLLGSIACQIAGLKINTKRIVQAGAIITSLTAELASTRKQLKSAKGEDVVAKEDMARLTPPVVEEGEDETTLMNKREDLYTIIYDKHLLCGMDTASCLRQATNQLIEFEKVANRKLNSPHNHPSDGIGRYYYGDILKALIGETNECGQNTGWITRDYPSEYDGYISFGCWTIDEVTGIKRLNPDHVDEYGRILLEFNVEGEIENLIREAKKLSSFRK